MTNRLIDLNNHLFSQLERLTEENITPEQIEQEVNQGGPFIFCAQATGDDNYCWHHLKRAYRPKESE